MVFVIHNAFDHVIGKRNPLFFIGIVLFMISLAVNLTAASLVFRQRKRAERILS
ncbi:MAG: hypothetical protein MUO38_12620 [Anaerolineales bacterium]|nr:hypothetical protein [Anaerolineales bacterium]